MKILPIVSNTPQMAFGAFMEGAVPSVLKYDMQTVLNDMVTGRLFSQTPAGAGLNNLSPLTNSSYQMSPPPAWTTAQGFRGKRVLPKVTLRYSDKYSDFVTNSTSQLDVIAATILNHRCVDSTTASKLTGQPASATVVMLPPVKNADGFWEIANYDFGADVIVNSLASFIRNNVTAGYNIFAGTAANEVWLQVLVGSIWTDVVNLSLNLVTTSTGVEKYYTLPTTVTGRKFRIVSKAANNPFSSGVSTFALHFYGDYVAGVAPRTFSKIGHAVMFTAATGATFNGNLTIGNPAGSSFQRFFSHYALTITDDMKQAATADVVISDATVYPGQEQAIGNISIVNNVLTTEVY